MQVCGGRKQLWRQCPREPASFNPAASAIAAPVANGSAAAQFPGFDVEGFVRNAKVNFIRLQASNDAGNLDDIREFTSPEMFAEIKMEMGERGHTKQETDVAQLNGEVLDVAEEANRYIVSIRFTGLISEERSGAGAIRRDLAHDQAD
jgi:predicted lipid-binding transport protein (Tim44 family)